MNEAIPGVILAGGLSSRMGQDKAGLRLGGMALIDRAARRLRPQVSALAVNANGPVVFAPGEDLPVFADLDADLWQVFTDADGWRLDDRARAATPR